MRYTYIINLKVKEIHCELDKANVGNYVDTISRSISNKVDRKLAIPNPHKGHEIDILHDGIFSYYIFH